MPQFHSQTARPDALDDPVLDASHLPATAQPWERTDWEAWTPRGPYGLFGKRILDLVLLLATAPLTLPLLVLVGALSSHAHRNNGGALFRQARVGRRGKTFRLVKFRTMAPALEEGGPMQVTRLGRWLRNTHLDELPQIYHVLRGEMSFIGPRPEMVEIEAWAAQAVPAFSRRLSMRPGITGLAQITQGYTDRDTKAYRDKLRINDSYCSRLSLHRDLWILVKTVVWMARARGWRKASPADSLRYVGKSGPRKAA